MRTTGRLHRLIACLLLATTTLAACTSWQVQTVSPEQLLAATQPTSVRVSRGDGSQLYLGSPRLSGDSLVGIVDGKPTGVPLADVTRVEAGQGAGMTTMSPVQLVTGTHPTTVRVSRSDGARLVLGSPRIGSDSLLGTTKGGPAGVRLADVTQVEVRHADGLKTAGLVIGVAAVTVVVGLALWCNATDLC
jgi:hypothetical protein